MSFPKLAHTVLHQLETNSVYLPKEAFYFNGRDYMGAQRGAWETDELAWDHDNYGRWRGPAPLNTNALNLAADGAVDEFVGYDEIARLPVGATLRLLWGLDNPLNTFGAVQWRVILQNAETGVFEGNATVTYSGAGSLVHSFGVVPAGSYFAWVRVETATPAITFPPDYFTVTGYGDADGIPNEFRYIEDGAERIWDWLHDVGLRPSDPAQLAIDGTNMMAAHNARVVAGTLETRSAWTTYIRSGDTSGGEWTALRVKIGSGDWYQGAFQSAPGDALFYLTDGARVPVRFDMAARSISASRVLSDGKCYIAGNIVTRAGLHLALWELHSDNTGTLLGTNQNETNNICEFALLDHSATDILETREKTGPARILVLSMGGLHEYDSAAALIPDALPGVPVETNGHPGGRALRQNGRQIFFFTENFGSQDAAFYNRLQEQVKGRRLSGPGTVFHGHNCCDVAFGAPYGINQVGAFGSPIAQQYIAYLENGVWNNEGMESFSPATHRWQRVCAWDARIGHRLLVAGKAAQSQEPIWGVADGTEFVEAQCPWRVRRLTRVYLPDGTERVYGVAFQIELNSDDLGGDYVIPVERYRWAIISIGVGNSGGGSSSSESGSSGSGGGSSSSEPCGPGGGGGDSNGGDPFPPFCMMWNGSDAFSGELADAEAAGLEIEDFKPFLWRVDDIEFDTGGWWWERDTPPGDGRAYLEFTVAGSLLSYTVPPLVTLPYDACFWALLCITDTINPKPPCDNLAQCFPRYPEGTEYFVIRKRVAGPLPWTQIQVSDESEFFDATALRRLTEANSHYPLIWARFGYDSDLVSDDSSESSDGADFSTFRYRLPLNRFIAIQTTFDWVELLVVMTPGIGNILAPTIDLR